MPLPPEALLRSTPLRSWKAIVATNGLRLGTYLSLDLATATAEVLFPRSLQLLAESQRVVRAFTALDADAVATDLHERQAAQDLLPPSEPPLPRHERLAWQRSGPGPGENALLFDAL